MPHNGNSSVAKPPDFVRHFCAALDFYRLSSRLLAQRAAVVEKPVELKMSAAKRNVGNYERVGFRARDRSCVVQHHLKGNRNC